MGKRLVETIADDGPDQALGDIEQEDGIEELSFHEGKYEEPRFGLSRKSGEV